MNSITLSQHTIRDILHYCRTAADRYEAEGETRIEGVEFPQDGCTVIADYEADGHVEEHRMVHNEVPPPNIEDISTVVCDYADVADVHAYDADDNELAITNLNELRNNG